MDPFSATVLAQLTADLTGGVVSSLSGALKRQLSGTPEQQALERSIRAGIVALVAQTTAATATPEEEDLLADIFEKFFHHPVVWVAVGQLIGGTPLDHAQLRGLFTDPDDPDTGYDLERLQSVDFDAALDAFTAAFVESVRGQKELAHIVQSGLLGQLVRGQGESTQQIRELVARIDQLATVAVRAGNVVDGASGQVVGKYIAADEVHGPKFEFKGDFREATIIINPSEGVSKETADELLRPYLETVVRRCGRLPLGPLNPGGQDTAHLALLKVFINLDAGEKLVNEDGVLRRYTSAIAHTHENERLIILGDPGSGKSTLFRFLAFCLAGARLNAAESSLAHLSWDEARLSVPPGEDVATYAANLAEFLLGRERERFFGRPFGKQGETIPELVTAHWTRQAAVPIQVELRNFAQTDFDPRSPVAIWKHVVEQLERDDLSEAIPVLKEIAQRGEALFLFDGVDEVPPARRPDIWRAIAALAKGPYGGCPWLAACRVLSFVPAEAPDGVPAQTLAPLTPEQIDAFVVSWYETLAETGERIPPRSSENLQAATRRPRLRTIARNPMLLTIMALVQTYYGTLPDERARLYQQCVETLLLRWQRHKEESEQELPDLLAELGTNQQELERLLWEVGWEAHNKGFRPDAAGTVDDDEQAADLPESEVMAIACRALGSWGRAEQFITYTERRAHLLLGRGGTGDRQFTFPHRTFQEYLAACHLASDRRPGERARELARQGDYWREVLNLTVGTLVFNQNNREKALDAIARLLPATMPADDDMGGWRCVWLAGEMAEVVGREAAERDETGREILPRLRKQLAALVSGGHLASVQRAAAGVALGRLGDPREDVNRKIPDTVLIPAGPFRMGSDVRDRKSLWYDGMAYDGESPSHEIAWLDFDYRIGRYPVTVAQYRHFVEAGGYDLRKSAQYWQGGGLKWLRESEQKAPRYWDDPQWTVDNHPVVGVTWYEAVAYCNWLNAIKPAERGFFRLPDEAMWEKAARGMDGRRWPWEGGWDVTKLNSREGGINRTSAVGIFPAGKSPFDVYDCAGNVWEWCSGPGIGDAPYPFKRRSYKEDLELASTFRALRGGSWHGLDQGPRAACRDDLDPGYGVINLGLRVVELLSDSEF